MANVTVNRVVLTKGYWESPRDVVKVPVYKRNETQCVFSMCLLDRGRWAAFQDLGGGSEGNTMLHF